jgi:hypothetical protein
VKKVFDDQHSDTIISDGSLATKLNKEGFPVFGNTEAFEFYNQFFDFLNFCSLLLFNLV